jgi:hypothetical protein
MSKYLGLIVFLLLGQGFAWGQASFGSSGGVVFLNKNSSTENAGIKRGSFVGEHFFGDSVAILSNTFEKLYVYYTLTSGAYPTEREHINKPTVYKSVKKIEKNLINAVKNKSISLSEGKNRYLHILFISIKMKDYDTSKVETELKTIKNPSLLEEYFNNLKFND